MCGSIGATLLFTLLACHPRGEDSDTPDLADDSGAPADDSGAPVEGQMPWGAEAFWTDPGPLEPFLEPQIDLTDTSLWYMVFMATSQDGITWEGDPQPVVKAMNSLDLWITDDGVILQGLVQHGLDLELTPGTVYGIQSADLEHWASHAWEIQYLEGGMNLVDPSLTVRAPAAPMLTYYKADFADPGDPIDTEGPHEIWRAVWDGTRWLNDRLVYTDDGLADPGVCSMGGTEWLFATQDSQRIIVARGDGDTFTSEPDLTWENRAVPYCLGDDERMTVLSQALGGMDVPTQRDFLGDGWGEETNLYDAHPWPFGQCASPVVGRYKDQWIAFCAIDWLAYLGTIGVLGRPEAPGT